ncbi:phosphate starvation-inducible protein PhoH [Geodermatophilus africanus]|uniref:PhoH-like protein n=1 Tax=Geodermatophilus africanus TaxID=1137993 RepID=A0A1H3NYE6_9ACTN|nr:PhoH family protein [Geodermatophilus africanus]SDY93818.1 phosphate starvation-inducible protein PhoH [Geodermatophilus africanus]
MPAQSGSGLGDASTAVRTTITVPDSVPMVSLLGSGDELLRLVENEVDTDVHVRGNEIAVTGQPADNAFAVAVFDELIALLGTGQLLRPDSVRRVIGMLRAGGSERPADVLSLDIISRRGRTIRPKTLNQKRYVDAIDAHTIVFGIGPAGTGKTYLAMAKAVQALQTKQVNRIILTRPAVEAGERLGYLPGTLSEKIDPYLRPLYDALHDMVDPESIPRLMQSGTIEVAPLAYMRGRAQPYDAQVLTPAGFVPVGTLRVGDLVIGSDGTPTPVLGVYPQGRKEVYRVATQDGAWTLACGEHLWTVTTPEDRRRGKTRTLETQEMVGRLRRGGIHRYELPLVEPVHFEPQDVPLDPYALGLLLGDGCPTTSTTPAFATADPQLVAALESALDGITVRQKSGYDYVLHHEDGGRGGLRIANPVTAALRRLELAGTTSATKFVPEPYLHNSAAVRTAVLQGLLDSDGGPVVQRGRTCRIQYTTTSPGLKDGVTFLVRSLGGVVHSRVRAAAGRRPGRAQGRPVEYREDAYVLDIRLPAGVQPFRLERKRQVYDAAGGGRPMRFLDSIEPVGEQETLCIQVAAQDSLYVTDDFLVTHNTLNDAFVILDEAQNTTAEQMKMFLTRLGFGSKIVVTGDVTQVDLPGGAQSGLRIVREILDGIEDVHFANLTSADVVRHRLVGDIVDAYERWDSANNQRPAATQQQPARPARPRRQGS